MAEDLETEDQGVDPLALLDDEQLNEMLVSRRIALSEVSRQRKNASDQLTLVERELGKRREERRLLELEDRRRRAVASGEKPPLLPVSGPPPRAANARLQGFSLSLGRTVKPVGEAVPVPPPPAPTKLEVFVTDHAVVRYLERVTGVDTQAIRDRILTPVVRSALEAGVERIRVADGLVVARGGVVTSFLPHEAGPARGAGHKIRIAIKNNERDRGPREDDWMEGDDDQES